MEMQLSKLVLQPPRPVANQEADDFSLFSLWFVDIYGAFEIFRDRCEGRGRLRLGRDSLVLYSHE